MLSGTALEILDVLCSQWDATAKELAAETGHSRKQIYRVVDDLLEANLVDESRQHHNQRVVRATDDAVVEAYRHLTSKLSHVDWSKLLSPATIRVGWYLDEPRRITAIADRLGITRQAVHKALGPLKNRAMLAPSGQNMPSPTIFSRYVTSLRRSSHTNTEPGFEQSLQVPR